MSIAHVATMNTVRKLAEYASRAARWRSGGSDPTRLNECRIFEMIFMFFFFIIRDQRSSGVGGIERQHK